MMLNSVRKIQGFNSYIGNGKLSLILCTKCKLLLRKINIASYIIVVLNILRINERKKYKNTTILVL